MTTERQIEGCSYYTVPEIAQRLGLCQETIRRLIRANALPAGRLGRTYFIRGDEIHRALNERQTGEDTPGKEAISAEAQEDKQTA